MVRHSIVQVCFIFTLCCAGGSAQEDNCTGGVVQHIGDDYCDASNNNERCLYDGGDCCECTSIDNGFSYSDTSSSSFLCVDPSSSCYSPTAVALQSSCINGTIEWIQDGLCDSENNNEGCLFDGGDCCECTGIDNGFSYFDISYSSFLCVNAEVATIEAFFCKELLLPLAACPPGYQQEWVVENATQAWALAEAVRCSGGSFNVTWKGNVIVNKTISIVHGTVLNVAGINADSVLDGDGKYRLFTVVNASLNLSNITISNGKATYGGGALAASYSRLSFSGVAFTGNSATHDGGALHVSDDTPVYFDRENWFLDNTAYNGGALYVMGGSSALWAGKSFFSSNIALSNGGALAATDNSSAVWTGDSHFLNNTGRFGGALYVTYNSSALWTAKGYFRNNSAGSDGGALCLRDTSSAVWTAGAHFLSNSAGLFGGALDAFRASSIVWSAEAYFINNKAGTYGGALSLVSNSSAIWTAEAHFLSNSAYYGGALYVHSASSVVWTGAAHFLDNNAYLGGALYVAYDSSHGGTTRYGSLRNAANWTGACRFSGNSVLSNGGAVYASNGVYLSWSNKTLFIDNDAENGGTLFVSNTVNTQWSGETNFTSNYARVNGGAVGHFSVNVEGSFFAINGPTNFVNNKCGVNGGAMSLVQSLDVAFGGKDVLFFQNSAGASGGAVFIVSIGVGTVFKEVIFAGNFAQTGGGVHSAGCGTEVTVGRNNKKVVNPMTFDRCTFVGNYAFATGGAVDSASGQDVFVRTSFKGNKARLGGALRLTGIASIDNCSFEENISELGGEPAASNLGYISNVTNTYFNHNIFQCEAQTFLNFNELDDTFETVCNGCTSKCFGCSFGEANGSPTCTSLSEAGVEHATSKGGHTTVEELLIQKGYWRATTTSKNILRCFNTKACKGGLTGASEYCLQGYEGPYCSVCSKNYVHGLSFTCRKCSDRKEGIIIATALVLLALVIGFSITWYLVSAKVVGASRVIVDRVMERLPLQSIKVIITVWQILTQFTSVANVNFPNVYQKFLDGVNFLNFDLSWVLSAGCFLHVDFHDRLLWTTIAPLVIIGLLGVAYAITVYRNFGSPENVIRNVQHKHISMVLLVTFLVYSSVSSVVFQAFACEYLDDGKRYLRADYTIECDSPKHRMLQIYSGFMMLLYPVGIPALYAILLFRNSTVLRKERNREEFPIVRSISNLWNPYKPHGFYYEVIECARRILLTGVIVFIYPNSAAQIAVTFAIAVVFIFVSEGMAPYWSPWDAWISRMGHAIIFASMYLALLLKVNVSGENDASQKMFEVILVATHGCMILAVVLQAVIMALSLRAGVHQEDPRPRLRRPSNLTLTIQPCLVYEDDDSKDELSPVLVGNNNINKDEL